MLGACPPTSSFLTDSPQEARIVDVDYTSTTTPRNALKPSISRHFRRQFFVQSSHSPAGDTHTSTMQRPGYPNPPPAHSPPLHHPVPQHVSTVPQLRSPPPPQPPSQPHAGYGYGQQQGGPSTGGGAYSGYPAFGGFMNDPTAQMGFQIGKSAVDAGQQYMEQNVCFSFFPTGLPNAGI